jgi:hypothetical protein
MAICSDLGEPGTDASPVSGRAVIAEDRKPNELEPPIKIDLIEVKIISSIDIAAKLAYWLVLASRSLGQNRLLEKARSYRDREINAETAITAITSIGNASLILWLLFQ